MFPHFSKLSAAITSVLLSCSSVHAANELIVASLHNTAEPFFVAMQRELRDEAKKLKVKAVIVDGNANSAKQTADIENALVQNARGIILAPTDVKALAPAVNEVLQENIPLITVDRQVQGTRKPVPHIGADNVAGGRKMVEWIVDQYPSGAKIILLTGQPGSSSAIDRTRGIREALIKAGNTYQVISEQTANWKRDEALTVTQNLLTSLGDNLPDVILAQDDDMALGALEALRAAGLDKTGIKIMGWNATPAALRRIRDGALAVTVEQSPSRQIRIALREMVSYLREKKSIQSLSIEPVLITRDNLEDAERLAEVK